jgi:hypothetical protein
VQESIAESSTSSLSRIKKILHKCFPQITGSLIFCTGSLKHKTYVKCEGLPSNANRQKIHYHPTMANHKYAIQNAHPRDKRGLKPCEILKNGNEMWSIYL